MRSPQITRWRPAMVTMLATILVSLLLVSGGTAQTGFPSDLQPLHLDKVVSFYPHDYDLDAATNASDRLYFPSTSEQKVWRGILGLAPDSHEISFELSEINSTLPADVGYTVDFRAYYKVTTQWFERDGNEIEIKQQSTGGMGIHLAEQLFTSTNASVEKNTTLHPGGAFTNGKELNTYEHFAGEWVEFTEPEDKDLERATMGETSLVLVLTLNDTISWNHTLHLNLSVDTVHDPVFYDYLHQQYQNKLHPPPRSATGTVPGIVVGLIIVGFLSYSAYLANKLE